jgi:hypothetical protein
MIWVDIKEMIMVEVSLKAEVRLETGKTSAEHLFPSRFSFWLEINDLQSIEMTTTLVKKTRQAPLTTGNLQRSSSEESGSSEIHAQEIFRRHFEARFKPLPTVEKSVKVVEETPRKSSEEDSEWDGISDEEERGVQVVEHVDAQLQMTAMSKAELKAFMVRFLPSILLLVLTWS